MLFAGCASQHSYYTAERPHMQREQLIAESNRFPTAANRDTYQWYQKDKSRNMKVGGVGTDYPAYGPTAPVNTGGSWPCYYAPPMFW